MAVSTTALAASELRRFVSRRIGKVTLVLFAGLFVLGAGVAFAQADSKADREAERAAYEREIDRCVEDLVASGGLPVPVEPPGAGFGTTSVVVPTTAPAVDPALQLTEAEAREYCESYTYVPGGAGDVPQLVELWPVETAPPTTEVLDGGVGSPGPVLVTEPEGGEAFEGEDGEVGLLLVPAVLLFLGGVVVGASAVGADWRHGVWTTTLTWESRRARLLLTRLAVVGAAVLAGALVLQAVFCLATLPVFVVKGDTTGADAAWFAGLVLASARIALVVAVGSVIGGSLAMLGRNTAVPIGGFALYAVAIEPALSAWRPRIGSHLLMQNAVIVMGDDPQSFIGNTDYWVRTPGEALVVVALYAAVAVLAATAVFRRRDLAAVS
ncbi:MAG: hypothetical protein MUF83_09900 [Acidimicrobiales bacterium]|jgi:hypothetical protein|nr:hypothetical protein [Acidimicrobiales bacterium]